MVPVSFIIADIVKNWILCLSNIIIFYERHVKNAGSLWGPVPSTCISSLCAFSERPYEEASIVPDLEGETSTQRT